MKRLTKRDKLGYAFIEKKKIEDYVVNGVRICASDAIDKLAKLEDLEERYNIELEYLFQLLEQGTIFVKNKIDFANKTSYKVIHKRRILAIFNLDDEDEYIQQLNHIEELRLKGDK